MRLRVHQGCTPHHTCTRRPPIVLTTRLDVPGPGRPRAAARPRARHGRARGHVTPPPPEHRADPSLTTYVERLGPFKIGAYETLQKAVTAKPPQVAGAIVAMDARLVDRHGKVLPQHITMLHHLVFTNGGPDDRRARPACPLKTTRERFWGTSEELRPLTLPPGYGYPTDPADTGARS